MTLTKYSWLVAALLRAIGQLQRYKDAPQERFRDDWVGRARLQLELGF